jgi:predicted MPP superfamily phosphohydrolase
MPSTSRREQARRSRYRRARIRHFLFTIGPDRLAGGRIMRRHLEKGVEIREVEVHSPRWPAAFDGMRIGHVSDFHLGDLMPIERAMEIVGLLGDQQPDFVACTGDVVDLHHHDADRLLEALVAINAPCGAALVLGNHDELHCPDTISRMARDAGMLLLRDEAVQISLHGEPFVVAGIDWAKSAVACRQRIDRACGDSTHLLLSHNPRAFGPAAALGIPLTLAGHTHGGQLAIRRRSNTNLALTHRHSAGLFKRGPSRMYVTSGVGAWFPLRVNCPAEVAIITMRHDPDPIDHEPVPERRRLRTATKKTRRTKRKKTGTDDV